MERRGSIASRVFIKQVTNCVPDSAHPAMVEEQKEMSLNPKGLVTQNGPQSQEAATTTKLYLLALPR